MIVSLYGLFRLTQIIAKFYNLRQIKAIFMLALMWLQQVGPLKVDGKRARVAQLGMDENI